MQVVLGRLISTGIYGSVYEGIEQTALKQVAVKEFRRERHNPNDGIDETTLREIAIHKSLSPHPQIVEFYGVIMDDQGPIRLVMEWMPTDFHDLIHRQHRNNREIIVRAAPTYFHQLLSGIAHCHDHRIIHRDLKPTNILVDRNGNLKLTDFGLAIRLPNSALSNEVVSLWYRAPELLCGASQYNGAIDIWSLGCIFVEILSLIVPFQADTPRQQLAAIFYELGTPSPGSLLVGLPGYSTNMFSPCERRFPRPGLSIPFQYVSLLEQMLSLEADQRPSARDLIRQLLSMLAPQSQD